MSNALAELAVLARMMRERAASVERAEEALSRAKELLREIVEEDIPQLLIYELELRSVKLEDGSTLDVKDDVYASLSEERKAAAFRWLEEKGFGGLIKTEVSVQFSRSERAQADVALKLLQDAGYHTELSRSIHASTLSAFLREQLAEASDIPLELFGARPVKKTVLKGPRR